MRPQERDREIMKWVYDCRLLTSRQINRLVSGSDQWILRRLQRLFHHGYLDRVRTPSYNEAFVYGIGNKGMAELALRYADVSRGKADWTSNNREVGGIHIAHTLMGANFRVTLTLGVRERPGTDILTWIPDRGVKEKVVYHEKRLPIEPDSFIALNNQGKELFFLPEFDRSTMTDKRFLGKLKGFWHWWKQGLHRKFVWGYRDAEGRSIRREGIGNFRVPTVTLSEERADNLRRVAKQVGGGQGMFLFTSQERFNPDDPASIFMPIWQTPKDDTWHSLLE